VPVAAAAAFGFWRAGRPAHALLLLGVLTAGHLFGEGVKELVRRPRPEVARPLIKRPRSFSFPSGHALSSATTYGTLAALLAVRCPRRWQRGLLFAGAAVLVLLIGASRVYLGVHYLSDVLGGWAAGLAFVLLVVWWDRGRNGPLSAGGTPPAPPQ
jgi:undecaprenyl-diphosphatase